MMTFEEFEKAEARELRQHAKRCFELGQLTNTDVGARPSYLLEAQFYMSEIDRREANIERQEDRRIALRSHRIELSIIALIILEILIAFGEGKKQAEILERQASILERVEKAATGAGNMNLVRP
jgi:hypothetical protein